MSERGNMCSKVQYNPKSLNGIMLRNKLYQNG